jgi:hypothetical protein
MLVWRKKFKEKYRNISKIYRILKLSLSRPFFYILDNKDKIFIKN